MGRAKSVWLITSNVGVMIADRIKADTGTYFRSPRKRRYETICILANRYMVIGSSKTTPSQNTIAVNNEMYSSRTMTGTATPVPKLRRNCRPVGSKTKYAKAAPNKNQTTVAGRNITRNRRC